TADSAAGNLTGAEGLSTPDAGGLGRTGNGQGRRMPDPEAPPRLELSLPDPGATANLARLLAAAVRPGDLIALAGDLGAGKSTFARAFVHARQDMTGTPREEVPSPTFTLVQTYEIPGGAVWHFDLYRLSQPEEAGELGLDEALTDGIVLI